MNDGAETKGIARDIPEFFYQGFAVFRYWDNNNIKHKIRPNEAKSFLLNDKYYESVKCKERANIFLFPKTLFMRRIIQGKMNLYIVSDYTMAVNCLSFISGVYASTLDYYYIRKETDRLVHKIYKTKNAGFPFPTIIIQPNNKKEFIRYFYDTPSIQRKIIYKDYKRRDIYKIVQEYNSLIK